MKPGWRVFAGAATAVVVWTLGLCAWALVTVGGPTLDLGPTVAIEAPDAAPAPAPVTPESLPSAGTEPTGTPADVPVPTETDPAPPVEPSTTTRSTPTTGTALAPAAAPTAAPEPVAPTVAARPPAATPPGTHAAATPGGGWPRPSRPATHAPSTIVDEVDPDDTSWGERPSADDDEVDAEPGCDDDNDGRDGWEHRSDESASTGDRW